jgi:hypothetical protein
MVNLMKNKILRFLLIVFLITLISGAIVLVLGLILKWTTYTQFSNAFFIAGAILFAVGAVNLNESYNNDGNSGYVYSRTNRFDRDEGFRLRMSDIAHGFSVMSLVGTSGLLVWGLAGLAILIGR